MQSDQFVKIRNSVLKIKHYKIHIINILGNFNKP